MDKSICRRLLQILSRTHSSGLLPIWRTLIIAGLAQDALHPAPGTVGSIVGDKVFGKPNLNSVTNIAIEVALCLLSYDQGNTDDCDDSHADEGESQLNSK